VFTAGSFTVSDNFTMVNATSSPASLFANGSVTCNSSASVGAYIQTASGATIVGNCRLGGIWAKGSINTDTTGVVIDGNVTSATGGLTMGANPIHVGGNITLAGTVHNTTGHQPVVGGVILQNQTGLLSPEPRLLPRLTYNPLDWPGWSFASWSSFIQAQAAQNHGSGSSPCKVSSSSSSVNGSMVGPATPTVLDARSCSKLQLAGSEGAVHLALRSDLTIFVKSMETTGSITITSYDGLPHTLRIVSPWVNPGTACSASGAGSITLASGLTITPKVSTLIYSAATIDVTSSLDFYGQVYACSVAFAQNTTLHYVPVGVPAR
jgi:hypothetical protein